MFLPEAVPTVAARDGGQDSERTHGDRVLSRHMRCEVLRCFFLEGREEE